MQIILCSFDFRNILLVRHPIVIVNRHWQPNAKKSNRIRRWKISSPFFSMSCARRWRKKLQQQQQKWWWDSIVWITKQIMIASNLCDQTFNGEIEAYNFTVRSLLYFMIYVNRLFNIDLHTNSKIIV